jgi:hypothetical protein
MRRKTLTDVFFDDYDLPRDRWKEFFIDDREYNFGRSLRREPE